MVPDTREVIQLPYSFFSKNGHEEIVKQLTDMGYWVVKTYPEEEKKPTYYL